MNKIKETQNTARDVAKEIKKQKINPTRKINHWWIKSPDLEDGKKSKDPPTSTEGDLPTFAESRKRREITTPTFTDGELPTFTEGRENKSSTFTDDELPSFTEGKEKRKHRNTTIH